MVSRRDDPGAGIPDQHILIQGGKWAVVPEGADDPMREFETQDDALRWAGRALSHQGATLIVHNEDGSVNDTIRPEP